MNEQARWIEYQGHRVLLNDYRGLANQEYTEAIVRRVAEITESGNREILLLLDVTDSYVDKETLHAFKQAGKEVRPYVRKLAVIGVSGVQKFFLPIINQFSNVDARAFNTERAALDWLTT